MYATWKDYNIITNNGKQFEMIAYDPKNRSGFVLMSGPAKANQVDAMGYWSSGEVREGLKGGNSSTFFSARPALHR